MLKLKLQYFDHLMRRVDSLEKTLMLGGIGVRRRRGWQRMRWLDGITDSMMWGRVNSRSWWWTGRPGVLQFMGSQRVGHYWATELNWTEFTLIHRPNIPSSCAILFFQHQKFTAITSHIHNWVLFSLWLSLFILLELFLYSTHWAPTELVSSSFRVISFCLLKVVCHSLLQWTTFCQNSPPWPNHLEWPYTAWLIVSLGWTRLWSKWSVWLVFRNCGFHSVGLW